MLPRVARCKGLCGLSAALLVIAACRPGSIDSDSSGDSNSTDDPEQCGSGVPKSGKYCFERVVVPDIEWVAAGTAYPLGADRTGLVVAHGTDNRLSLFGLDEGTPRLLDQIEFPASALWSSHLDTDSFADIVASPMSGSSLRVVRGNENSFGDVVTLLDDGPLVRGVALIDANGDGITEILAGGSNHGTLWALTDGVWEAVPGEIELPACKGIVDAEVADIDNNGSKDIVLIGWSNSIVACKDQEGFPYDPAFHAIVTLLTDGSTLQLEQAQFPAGTMTGCLAVGDFDGDDNVDIAVGSDGLSPYDVYLHRGLGDGTFDSPMRMDTEHLIECPLVAGDFDGDGDDELWKGYTEFQIVETPFDSPTTHDIQLPAGAVFVEDFNHDGIDDIAAVSHEYPFSILLSNP